MKFDVEKLPATLPNKRFYVATKFYSKEGSILRPLIEYIAIVKIVNI